MAYALTVTDQETLSLESCQIRSQCWCVKTATRFCIREGGLDSLKLRGVIESIDVKLPDVRRQGDQIIEIKVIGRASENIDEHYEERYNVMVEVVHTLCPICRSVRLGRERAVVQIRSFVKSLSRDDVEMIKQLISYALSRSEEKQRGAIIDIKVLESGIDVRTTSTSLARSIASVIRRNFPSVVDESKKIVGFDRSGRHITRLNICVKILPLRRGDVIRADGHKLYYVLAVSRSGVHVKDLETQEREFLRLNMLLKRDVREVKCREELAKVETTNDRSVVKVGDEVIELRRRLPHGCKVKILIIDDKRYVIDDEVYS